MALLSKLKSLLGFGGGADDRQADTTVTVEHDPEDAVDEPAADTATAEPAADSIAADVDEQAAAGDDGDAVDDDEPTAGNAAVDAATDDSEATDEPAEATEADATEVATEEPAEVTGVDDQPAETDDQPAEADDQPAEADDQPAEADETADAVEADTAEPAESAAVDDGDSDEPLDSIKGIGPAYSERLTEAGIDSVAELAEGDAEAIGEAISVSPKTVSNWIDRATEK